MARRDHILSLPNALTVIRLPMAALLWARPADEVWLAAMLAAAALSDILDGKVARWIRERRLARGEDPGNMGESQAVGAWLDPLCDKAFAASAMVYIVVGWQPPLWLAAIIVAREVVLVPFAIGYRLIPSLHRRFHFDFRASYVGKAGTVAQFAAFCSIVFYPRAQLVLAIVAGSLGLIAASSYLRRALITARYIASNQFAYERWQEIQEELHG